MDMLTLLAFAPAALALNMTPGADMMFCFGQGLRGGARSAWAASGGIALGAMVQVTCAGLGLGALVAAQPWLFDVIRWGGVAYLLWLAAGAIRNGVGTDQDMPEVRPARAFGDGMIVNLMNPKVILFVLAFIPQFVDPAAGSVLIQFLILGAILSLGGFVINGLIGAGAGGVGRRIMNSQTLSRGLGIAVAGIFTLLAARLAVLERG